VLLEGGGPPAELLLLVLLVLLPRNREKKPPPLPLPLLLVFAGSCTAEEQGAYNQCHVHGLLDGIRHLPTACCCGC
jgi:hypothetical protein